jgi:hypothetical protein
MKTVIKIRNEELSESLLNGLIGKPIHAPTNKLVDVEGKEHNVWFAGIVAGYQKSTTSFDFENEKFLDSPKVQLHIILTDGMAYTLSTEALDINELTEDEFYDMVMDYSTKQLIKDQLLVPEQPEKKIVLPGKDF